MSFPLKLRKAECIQCGVCEEACLYHAIKMEEWPEIDENSCVLCKACTEVCPTEALIIELDENGQKQSPNNGSWSGVWVMAEIHDGTLQPTAFELLGAASEIASQQGQEVSVVLIGHDCIKWKTELFAAGADVIYTADHPDLKELIEDRHADILCKMAQTYRPAIILVPATQFGRGVSARSAASLNTGLTADCTELKVDEKSGNLLQIRPAFGGNLLATIETPAHRPQMATVRPRVMKPLIADYSRAGKIIAFDVQSIDMRVKLLETVSKATDTSITESPIIVAGGRGMKSKKHIHLLYELAEVVGGKVAASRAAVEAGWLPYEVQIGQTGKNVSPKLYISCGISGQIQHTAGFTGAETVIGINNDPDAAIFEYADFGMVGDVTEILPQLIQTINNGGLNRKIESGVKP